MIRTLTHQDFKACVEMFYDNFSNPPFDYFWLEIGNVERYFTDLMNTPCFMGLIYVVNEEILGFCFGVTSDYFIGVTFDIREIIVSRQHQSMGHGKKMMTEIENYLSELEISTITLATIKEIDAFKFYTKNGFKVSKGSVYMSKQLLNLPLTNF